MKPGTDKRSSLKMSDISFCVNVTPIARMSCYICSIVGTMWEMYLFLNKSEPRVGSKSSYNAKFKFKIVFAEFCLRLKKIRQSGAINTNHPVSAYLIWSFLTVQLGHLFQLNGKAYCYILKYNFRSRYLSHESCSESNKRPSKPYLCWRNQEESSFRTISLLVVVFGSEENNFILQIGNSKNYFEMC